jgi:hypothetical protein
MWLHESFRRPSPLRFLAGALAFGFLGANIANCLYYVRRNDFAHEFQPALATIEQLRRPADIVMAPSEFGFALGFHKPLVDDCYLGYASGIRARIYVMYSSCNPPPGSPAPWIWSREQLAAHYQTVYRNPAYAIYLRRPDGRTPVSAR